jgi:hypothetical protein
MKSCGYCGRENEDEAVHCTECGTVFEDMAAQVEIAAKGDSGSRGRKAFRILGLLCGLLALGLLAAIFSHGSASPGLTVSFSGYSTNSAGIRVGLFSLVGSSQQGLLYRAMSDPEWSSLLGSGGLPPFAPSRFVQYGRLPPFASRMRFEVPVPAGIPVDRRYRLTFAYCRDRGRFAEQAYRFWRIWGLRWVPHKKEPFPAPGFGSHTIASAEVDP